MQSIRGDLEQYKLSHNKFPKIEDIPKNIFNDFIISLETEIRTYYMNKEELKEKSENN